MSFIYIRLWLLKHLLILLILIHLRSRQILVRFRISRNSSRNVWIADSWDDKAQINSMTSNPTKFTSDHLLYVKINKTCFLLLFITSDSQSNYNKTIFDIYMTDILFFWVLFFIENVTILKGRIKPLETFHDKFYAVICLWPIYY